MVSTNIRKRAEGLGIGDSNSYSENSVDGSVLTH